LTDWEVILINKYDEHYYHRYALLSVCHLFNFDIEDFVICDKPDLQSQKLNIGIEVTRAITKHDGLTYDLVNSYFGKGLSGDEIVESINRINRKGKFKGFVGTINGVAIFSPTQGPYDSKKHRDLISNKILEKTQKFIQYKHFKKNGLYCFSHTSLINESDYPYILDACKNSAFSLIFINCIDTIFYWNSPADTFVSIKISPELLSKWKQESLNTRIT